MADIPGIIDRVNYVTKIVQNPCRAPWRVYVETAIAPAGRMLLSLVGFGMGDVIRGALRPRGTRIGSKTGRRKRKGRFRPGIPEFGNMLGAHLPGAAEARERKVSAGVGTLWEIDGVLQRLLWWWLVADVVSEFAFEWTSAIYQSEFCMLSGFPAASLAGNVADIAALTGWSLATGMDIEYQDNGAIAGNGCIFVPEGQYSAVAFVNAENTGLFSQEVEVGIFEDAAPSKAVARGTAISLEPGQSGAVSVSASMRGPGTYCLMVKTSQGFTKLTDGTYWVQGELPPPPAGT